MTGCKMDLGQASLRDINIGDKDELTDDELSIVNRREEFLIPTQLVDIFDPLMILTTIINWFFLSVSFPL